MDSDLGGYGAPDDKGVLALLMSNGEIIMIDDVEREDGAYAVAVISGVDPWEDSPGMTPQEDWLSATTLWDINTDLVVAAEWCEHGFAGGTLLG